MTSQGRRTIHGKCHCGNVRFELTMPDAPTIPARACSCSFCVKHGGVWTSHPAAILDIVVHDRALVSEYAFGTRTATFNICARCGVVPFVTSEIDSRRYAVVNVNAFEETADLPLARVPASFEGEDVEARLARRARNWIADVRIAHGSEPAGA